MSISGLSRPSTSGAWMMGTSLPVAVKTTSASFMTSNIESMLATVAFLPPRAFTRSSSRTAWALSTERFTSVTLMSGCLEKRASRQSLDILPAPTMQTCTLPAGFRRSCMDLDIMSSTAALETETEPLPILVRVRTSLPILMPAFSILAMILPPEPGTCSSSPFSPLAMQCAWHAFTCERICASPRTRESRPELTSKRWSMAEWPVKVKRYGSSSSRDRPDCCRKKAWTHSMAEYFFSSGEAK
mmetsp:Transcript_44787/g.104358  ORF Transcript_44787/g.104358 Transcript_44787/m.104358 type:complete len:243 (-) Transcript_44787:175-903(-)